MLEGRYWSSMLRPTLIKERALRDWIIWKHCDRFTSGILDFSLSLGKHTEWNELKIEPREEESLQRYYRERIGSGAHLIVVRKDLLAYKFDDTFYGPFRTKMYAVRSLSATIVMSTYA